MLHMRKFIATALLIAAASTTSIAAAQTQESRTVEQELQSNARRFERVDTNRDGKIDQAELRVENERIAARDGRPVSSGRGGVYGSQSDADGDGMVSLAESETAVRQQFARRDANNDGVVTPEERAAAR
ncbi:MAG: hypothetical protein HC774_01195 [Sphingomonadales bacterium]|nr:hypothetical protein [Sphingomonadales bacterium]